MVEEAPSWIGEPGATPYDNDAEQACLGSLLVDPRAFDRISHLAADDFYILANRCVYQAMTNLFVRDEPPDVVLVAQEIEAGNEWAADTDPILYLSSLATATSTSLNVEHYARVVARLSLKRKLIAAGEQISDLGRFWRKEPEEALDEAATILAGLIPQNEGRGLRRVSTDRLWNRLTRVREQGEEVGLATGLVDVDRLMGGLPVGMITVAGRTSMGKSALGLTVARNVLRNGRSVGLFSLEMTTDQIMERLMAMEADVSGHDLHTGTLSDADWEKAAIARARIEGWPLFIEDATALSITQIINEATAAHRRLGLALIVVDYIGLVAGTSRRAESNRVQEVSEVSRGLKALAGRLEIPVLVLAQLNRDVEGRKDHRPQLSDLKESGAIEEDSDVVWLLYREKVYNPHTTEPLTAEINIAKFRNGPTGLVEVIFRDRTTTFHDMRSYA